MPAQYANLDGRRFVNEAFVDAVRKLFPATTKKIPLGISVYTGWTGKDEVLFVQQGATSPDIDFDGTVYQVSFDPSHPECFEEKILKDVTHSTLQKASTSRARLSRKAGVDSSRWRMLPRQASGPLGCPLLVRNACSNAVQRLNEKAVSLVRRAMAQDDTVIGFLDLHAKRGKSLPAKALFAAYKSARPGLEGEPIKAEEMPPLFRAAANSKMGMYGYPAKTANLGLFACTALRSAAGEIAAHLHGRQTAFHGPITSFLGEHGKTARCAASKLILSCYPEPGFVFRQASEDDWLSWDY